MYGVSIRQLLKSENERRHSKMSGYNKFKIFLVEQGITQQEVADLLQITRSQLNLILNGQRGKDFTGSQILLLCNTYNISADLYFFKEEVSK